MTTTSSASVVITDNDHGHIEPETSVLVEAGHGVRLIQARTSEQLIESAAGARVLINQYTPITAEVLDALDSVQLVVRYGVGVDSVDVAAATERGVWVANVPDYGTEEVADHAIALALSMLRGTAALDRSVRSGFWNYRDAGPLRRFSTLTFGVIGCGAIGVETAAKAASLGMRVIGADIHPGRPQTEVRVIEEADLGRVLAESDLISLHATLDSASHHLIDADALSRMKPSAFLVNTARGGLVDSAALVAALDAGSIAGAGLDVLETEPPVGADACLIGHPRAIVTPHSAWYSEESFTALKTEVAREAVRVLNGERPRCPVNEPAYLRVDAR